MDQLEPFFEIYFFQIHEEQGLVHIQEILRFCTRDWSRNI